MSAVRTLREFGQEPAASAKLPGTCLDTLGGKPTDTGGSMTVVLTPPTALCADAFAVQIWVNDVGRITAVNLLLERP